MNRIFKPGKKDREYLFDKNEEEKRIDKRWKRKGRALKEMATYRYITKCWWSQRRQIKDYSAKGWTVFKASYGIHIGIGMKLYTVPSKVHKCPMLFFLPIQKWKDSWYLQKRVRRQCIGEFYHQKGIRRLCQWTRRISVSCAVCWLCQRQPLSTHLRIKKCLNFGSFSVWDTHWEGVYCNFT